MDAFTAGAALILVQLCMAVVMAGCYFAAPEEKSTKFWALAGLCVAAGLLIVVKNAGAFHPPIILLGNNLLLFGFVLQWWGVQAFFDKKPSGMGWMFVFAFFMLFCLLLAFRAETLNRALLSASAIFVAMLMTFHEIWRSPAKKTSFGFFITICGSMLLLGCYAIRIVLGALHIPSLLPGSGSPIGIITAFFGPMTGIQLLFSGFLLLYFEKIVEEKHHLATHDELTGILNRRAVDARGKREIELALRLRHPLCVAFVEIDHFKRINDRYGHEAGDRVIADVAGLLSSICRSMDAVGRYGGEEFCLILPGIAAEQSHVIGKRILLALHQHRVGPAGAITVSIGLAAWNAADGEPDWQALVRRADFALYQAKEMGRNRYCISSAAEASSTAGETLAATSLFS